MVLSTFGRALRFWSRRLLLLNVVLFGLAWLLYGSLSLRGYGHEYWARASDVFLKDDPARFNSAPGLENVLLPALAAAAANLSNAIGLEFRVTAFVFFTAIPYALFIYGVARHVSHRDNGGPVLALGAVAALYTTGMIPYMTSWGGDVDGLSYLLMLPVFIWPESLAVYAAAFILQCLNHYLGAIALLLFAFVWHSIAALDQTHDAAQAWRRWLTTFVPRAALSVAVLVGFLWFWNAYYPEAARVRQTIAAAKWQNPTAILQEILVPFPFTLLSALKLMIVPVIALMVAPLPHHRVRALVIATPFLAASALTFVFVDITRVATLLVLPTLFVVLHAAGRQSTLAPTLRRRLRRLVIVTALLGLLVPNYYVNNGEIEVPPSNAISTAIGWFSGQ